MGCRLWGRTESDMAEATAAAAAAAGVQLVRLDDQVHVQGWRWEVETQEEETH